MKRSIALRVIRALPVVSVSLAVLAHSTRAHAQAATTTAAAIHPATAGDCDVVVDVTNVAAATTIDVEIDKNRIAVATVQPAGGTIATQLRGLLEIGDEIRVLEQRKVLATATVQPRARNVAPKCGAPPQPGFDDRTNFEVTGYLGMAFDNFAPNEVGNYINAATDSTNIKSRFVAGTDAQFRFWPRDVDKRSRSDVQVWLSAETMHGVRSADVDCKKFPDVPVCATAARTDQKFLWILEHASSLEVFMTPRVELFTIQRDADTPIKAYVAARIGFLAAEGGAKLYRNDHVGGGILAPIGPFAGSYVEVGIGRSAMFHEAKVSASDPEEERSKAHWNRLKIDASLSFDFAPGWKDRINPFKRMAAATRGFVELYIDQSFHEENPQSVQSFAGIQFDFRDAFGK